MTEQANPPHPTPLNAAELGPKQVPVIPIPDPKGEEMPTTGSAAAEAYLREEGLPLSYSPKSGEAEQPQKTLPYSEPVMQVVPSPNPRYKGPEEPMLGSKRLKEEQEAGKKTLSVRQGNKVEPKKEKEMKEVKEVLTAPPDDPRSMPLADLVYPKEEKGKGGGEPVSGETGRPLAGSKPATPPPKR